MSQRYLFHPNGLPFKQHIVERLAKDIQWHSEFLIMFILEGNVNASCYGKSLDVGQNDILLFKPYELHHINRYSKEIKVLILAIDQTFIEQLCPDISEISLTTHHISQDTSPVLHDNICSKIADIVMNTIKNDSCSRLRMLSALASLLTTVIEKIGSRNERTEKDMSYIYQRMRNILNFIQTNYEHPISLQEISDELNIHPQYFSTFFKKQFGSNFTEYVNHFRVNRSLDDLLNTNKHIIDIAMECGFRNHKIYSTEFKKIFHMSPTQYRKVNSEQSDEKSQQELSHNSYLAFFQKYWDSDNDWKADNRTLQTHTTLSLDSKSFQTSPISNNMLHMFSIGRAADCLRADVQNQIRKGKRDLNIEYLRMRDIFSDDLFVYYEDTEGKSIYNWQSLDIIFDFLLSINIKPFPEISFMPRALASKKQYAGWQHRPNVSFPKSLKKWALLVSDFMHHIIDRYGINEILTWYFDFWTNANLTFKDGYWNESQYDFFLFYRVTYNAIKNIDERIRIGSPNFSMPSGIDWYQAFFKFCKDYELEPSYISVHLYATSDHSDMESNSFYKYSMDTASFHFTPKMDLPEKLLTLLKDCMKEFGYQHKPLIVSDWNISFIPKDYNRDTCFMASYIAHSYKEAIPYVNGISFRSLSDINEDYLPGTQTFHGGPGLMDAHGLKKASYNTFVFLKSLGSKILSTGDNYIFAKSDKGYQLLLYNMVDYEALYRNASVLEQNPNQRYNFFESNNDLVVHLLLELPPGNYSVKRSDINRSNGSSYDIWLQTGAPTILNQDILAYIDSRSTPSINIFNVDVVSHLVTDVILPTHGVTLVEVEKRF